MQEAARTLYLVCYDISDVKRWRRVHRYLIGYKVGGQKSFFECWLTAAELRAVRQSLAEMLDPACDRAHIFQLDPRSPVVRLGRAQAPASEFFLIV